MIDFLAKSGNLDKGMQYAAMVTKGTVLERLIIGYIGQWEAVA